MMNTVLKDKEVSCRMIFPVISAIKNHNLDVSLLLKDTGLDLKYISNPQNRFSWNQLSIIMNNLTNELGFSKEDLVVLGEQFKDSPLYKSVLFVFRLLFTLPEFYEWFHRPSNESPARQSISCITYEISSDAGYNYRLKFRLDEGYQPIWQFYYTSLGVIRVLPTIYGLPPVDVKIYEQNDGCVYHFRCPKTGGIFSHLRKFLTFPIVAKTAAETVVKTNRELFEANVKLQDENTRLVRTQKALKEAKKEAEEASKAKTQFLANISHEIRTPLNGIIGSLSLLLEDERDKEKLSSLKIINESSEVLLKLLNEILNFSKIESGNFDINLEPVNLYELQSETFDAFLSAAQQKNIALNSTCQIDPKHYFLGDALKIKQILNNLIANAIKFCDAGEVNINSLWQADTKTLVLTVSDTGIGIPEHQQNLIFSEFVQLDSTLKRRHEGAGLGLAITQRLVERMEGSIKLTSEVGKGSTFEITIPMESTNAPEPAIGKEESSEPETTLNILLVEDNKTNQLVISRLINKAGHEYTLAENGLERLEKMKHDQFDLILMDIMMPEMDGIEATREIRKIFSKDTLPILALSANTETENIEECLTVGMNEYLNKPIRMQELKSILNRYAPKLTAAESS